MRYSSPKSDYFVETNTKQIKPKEFEVVRKIDEFKRSLSEERYLNSLPRSKVIGHVAK